MKNRILFLWLIASVSWAGTPAVTRSDAWTRWTGESVSDRIGQEGQLGYYSYMNYQDGDYHLVFSPDIIRLADNRAWGRYESSGGTRVQGSFGYTYFGESGRMYVQSRNPYSGIPFLLADSSVSGGTMQRFTGNASLEKEFFGGKITGGAGFQYGIDDGYRTVFPKSESRHADRMIRMSAAVHFSKTNTLRYEVAQFEFQEMLITSKYQLEQNLAPVFYKISGLDFPVILRSTTSAERLQIQSGYQHDLSISNPRFQLALQAEWSDGSAEDGGAYRDPQGSWLTRRYTAAAGLNLHRMITVSGSAEQTDLLANHSDFDMEIFHFEQRTYQGGMILKIHSACQLTLSGGSDARLRSDRFTGIQDYFRSNRGEIAWAGHFNLSSRFALDLDVAAGYIDPVKADIQTIDDTNWYYEEFTAADEALWQMPVNHIRAGSMFTLVWHQKTFNIACGYVMQNTDKTSVNRQSASLKLAYAINE